LIFRSNKRFACICFIILLGSCTYVKAQDTVLLKDVEVATTKQQLSQIGKRREQIDSTVKEQFRFNSVGDLLSFNSAVFIKSYGPGALATTAFRGGNAAQTAILWNGFNIQNPMLGQIDLALMPSLLFENVEIEYGGSSSLWGSGAVGGSILLNNRTAFGKGVVTTVNLSSGSFGLLNGASSFLVSGKKFISSTKIYLNHSDNNYLYKDSTDHVDPLKRQRNAGYEFKGLMQEFKFLLSSKQFVSVNAWYADNERKLPAFDPQAESKAWQFDRSLRLTAGWNYVVSKFKSNVKAGFFNDKINYTDSLISLFSKSNAVNFVVENENYVNWAKNNRLNFGVNYTGSQATTDNYVSTKSLYRCSFVAGNKFSFFNNKFVTYISARAEYFSVGTLPVTGNAALEYQLKKKIRLSVNAAKVYRQPTLNELYWVPGGNQHLKPEQGYTTEGTVSYREQLKFILFEVSGSVYSRQINDWILWIPGPGGNPSPVNLQKVWSRGSETNWKLHFLKNKFRAGIGVITSYVLSTALSGENDPDSYRDDNTVSKQLIYTPRYTVNANIFLSYDKLQLTYYHQYIGYRFTTSDDSQWLDPYHVSSLRINYGMVISKNKFGLFASCNNLFNANYSVLAGRMMPLRNYEIGINMQTTMKQKQ
jgi:vitamin B12 transporter